ncbi:DUF6670 family protein [Acinetobacter oleivorans]|uniref:Uncharacterized protein n=1 Tax=Acinetobacter oleivorans (strain JCM 16667 / KCTC 23045 / DR1) TaxID=436717 RepID=A0AAN0UCI5_ACISD|nr:DUF6670 family protein [Acinetobacter oleivorans]ADI90062.1 hypothetical protein AOLE_05835 [Acinetobacter oleivorans DR1]ESK46536.1 hypothetical protein P254_00421 [Acinetobacter oleivorans CIP 110421]
MKKQLPKISIGSKLLGQSLLLAQSVIDKAEKYSTLPFSQPHIIQPRVDEKYYSWTHYGIFFPLLPEPHRYLNIMILLGTPGALAFDHDDIIHEDPRKTATFFSSTAAVEKALLKAYIIPKDTKINKDGSLIELGQEISIQGKFPKIHINGHYEGLDFDFDIDVTSHVSWFIKTPIYDHFSLLAKFKGFLSYQAERIESEGLCTYEYARAVGAHSIANKLIPEAYKLPLDFFTYQIINLNETTQLLLTKADIAGQTAAYTLHIRSLDRPAEVYTDVSFDIISHQVDDYISPTGQKMRLPKFFSWIARNEAKQIILNIQAEIDCPLRYGHGRGYASSYIFTGNYFGNEVQGRGYIEYIDVENQQTFEDE